MRSYQFTCSTENLAGLQPVVADALQAVAESYQAQTGQTFIVTSAWRSLRHCAELMAGFTQEQLEAMYCRRGYPDYIRQMVAAMQVKNAPLDTEETYQILCRRQEGYISYHLFGAAIDIATDGLRDRQLLSQLLVASGFSVSDETSLGIPCLHASYTKLPTPLPMITI